MGSKNRLAIGLIWLLATVFVVSTIPIATSSPGYWLSVDTDPDRKVSVHYIDGTVDWLMTPFTINGDNVVAINIPGAVRRSEVLRHDPPPETTGNIVVQPIGAYVEETFELPLIERARILYAVHFTGKEDVGEEASVTFRYSRAGPQMEKFRALVVKSPDAQLYAMLDETGHVLTDLIRTGDIETLDTEGFTITSAPGFHMGHIAYNIRPDQSYRDRPEVGPILSDVNFRHALFHLYDQEEIVASIYKYIVEPVQSLVPPAQGGWMNPEVPKHPYNPGDPGATTEYDPETGENEDACSILRYGGYLYCGSCDNWHVPHDLDGDGIPGTNHPVRPLELLDHDDVVPPLYLFTPTYEVAPTSAEHGARFIEDVHAVGLKSFVHDPREFWDYIIKVFAYADFDMYMVFWRLGRFPDHLYDMCHSSQDSAIYPWRYNAPGCHDPELDEAVFTLKTSLVHEEKLEACYKAQNILYNETYPKAAFAYMQLYSRILFNAFNPDLRGAINSPGYGSDNGWTHFIMHWEAGKERTEDGFTIVKWIWGEEPERLNPCYAGTVYSWDILGKTMDGLIDVNPYTHADMPGMAWSWKIEKWAQPWEVDNLVQGVGILGSHWHEDKPSYSKNRVLLNWTDSDESGTLTPSDFILLDDGFWYHVDEVSWDIKVENKSKPYADIKLRNINQTTKQGMMYDRYPVTVTAEYVGHGDGVTATFWLDYAPIVVDSETVFVDGVAQTRDVNYTINYDTGNITFITVPPDCSDITADYTYYTPPVTTCWEELWRQVWDEKKWKVSYKYQHTEYELIGWEDTGWRSYILDESDQIWLRNKYTEKVEEFHVDSVSVTLRISRDTKVKYIEYAGTVEPSMKVKFWLRPDVFWQDGNPYTAEDAKFNWLFFKNNKIPRYTSMWETIYDVSVVTDYKVVVYADRTSQFLLYDYAGTAAILPPPVWRRFDGKPLEEILAYDPSTNTTKPKDAGPWFGLRDETTGQPLGAVTQLYGTGPFIFERYDPTAMYADLWTNPTYTRITTKVYEELVYLFHRIGDVDYNGIIDLWDLAKVGVLYGEYTGKPYADEDVNEDGWVDMRDVAYVSYYWGDKREHP